MLSKKKRFILWFRQLSNKDVKLVGGKNASLGEMYSTLTKKGILIPNGFAITSYAYNFFLDKTKIRKEIKKILKETNTKNIINLNINSKKIRDLIIKTEFPEKLTKEIIKNYNLLCKEYGKNVDVAVRSSATAEDLPTASFAGQQETYLNIRGEKQLLNACKKCFASLFTSRAISYREDKHFNHFKVALSIGIQKMVRSDLASSGVIFTLDTETGFRNVVFINASYGLGENIVKGFVNPDSFYVFKPTINKFNPIISRKLGNKNIKLIYKGNKTKNISVSQSDRKKYCLTDKEIIQLSKYAIIIEQHYKKPMDIEWAKDGKTSKLFIVQARPETVHSSQTKDKYIDYVLKEKSKILVTGRAIGQKIGSGYTNIIKNVKDISKFKKNQVLVTEMTDPDWEPIMKIASAIITEKGGATSHAAIVSRELGIPAIVGTENATKILKNNQPVTIDCSKGELGKVYQGLLKYKTITHNIKKIPKTRTKIMVNIGQPEEAFRFSFLPHQGVGLAREEFIISSEIKIHPNALINYNKLPSNLKKQISNITFNYKDKKQYYIDKLAEGIAKIAAAFYPEDVIVRFSDFKTNEYANLIAGYLFEPKEENPMMAWRGASRYYDKNFIEAFSLECKAILKVLDEFGLTNIIPMVPFVRTVEEAKQVLKVMKKNRLSRAKTKIYAMCELPSNILLADKFLNLFDGYSIGSNDLTQFTLGVDRDSEKVSHIYDERNESVKMLIAHVIKICNRRNKYIGICGQAPSDYDEFAKFLIKNKIKSISLNPDVFIKTKLKVAKWEKK